MPTKQPIDPTPADLNELRPRTKVRPTSAEPAPEISAPEQQTATGISHGRLFKGITFVIICMLAGFVGSWIQHTGFATQSATVAENKRLLVKEDSAVIDVAKKVSPSVVSITASSSGVDVFGQTQNQESAGTGIIIKSDGLILTNKHVVEDAENFSVITNDGKVYKNAKVVAKDPSNDIAFVKIDAQGLPAAELGDSSLVQVGQRVIAIGNALGQFQNTVTTGVISGKGRPITASGGSTSETLQNLFQTDAAINPGNSGGPLVNIEGQVIGINTAVAGEGAQNIGFAIPINEAKNDIATVNDKGRIIRPYLGVRYVTLTQDTASQLELDASTIGSAYISGSSAAPGVISGSPADKAGLKRGDIITRIGDTGLSKDNSLTAIISSYKVGDSVKITFLRDGKEKVVTVKLDEAPAQ